MPGRFTGRRVEQPPPVSQTFPIAPQESAADEGRLFRFDQLSPDDRVLAAQSGKPVVSLAQNRAAQHTHAR